MQRGPSWYRDVNIPKFEKLNEDIETDIVIIGGGLTGITCAYLLSKAGKKVVLLEKDRVGSGASGMTTAFLTQNIDTGWSKLIDMFGKRNTDLIAESHSFAIDAIEKIIEENKIDCEFIRCNNYSYSLTERDTKHLKDEEKVMDSIGLKAKFKKDKLGFGNYGHLELKEQAKFHPLKYLIELTKISKKEGCKIFDQTEVDDIIKEDKFRIITKNGEVRANKVIVSTYAPINNKLYFKKAFYDSYVFELEISAKILEEGIYEDTMDPYHYFRIDRMGKKDRMIIGGEDHRSDIPVDDSKNFKALEDYIKRILSNVDYKIVTKWSGPIVEPVDGLAFIGEHKDKGIFYATGFSGNGMTYATLAAYMISDIVLGKEKTKKFRNIYDAERIPSIKQLAHKGVDYTRELIYGAIKNSLKYSKK